MSFFTNLGKGFIQSAVNQVGRDYGRTISNEAFGNRHSIPIRYDNNAIDRDSLIELVYTGSTEIGISKYRSQGYEIKKHRPRSPYNWFDYICLIILSCCVLIPVFGYFIWAWFVIKGLYLLVQKTDYPHSYAIWFGPYTQKVKDRRYASGYREETTDKLVIVDFKPTTKEKIEGVLLKLVFSLCHCLFPILLVLIIILFGYIVSYFNSDIPQIINPEIIQHIDSIR